MTDTSLPFRPRPGPSGASPLDAVEGQLQRVRRRANGYTLQQAVYPPLTALALGLCLLAALAVALSRAAFASAVWIGLAAFLLVASRSLYRGWQRWVFRSRAAVSVDRRAGLEDRLATFAALAPTPARSRLWKHLEQENLRLLPAWRPETVVPHAMPRSALVALPALLAALFVLGSRSGQPTLSMHPAGGSGENGENVVPEGVSGEGQASALLGALPEALRRALAAQGTAGARPGRVDGGVPVGGPPATDASRTASARDARPESLRRDGPSAGGDTEDGRGGKMKRPEANGEPLRGEGPKSLARVEIGKPREGAKKMSPGDKASQAGAAGGSGAGIGGSSETLFGEKGEDGRPRGAFMFDLDSERVARPGQGEGDDVETTLRTDLAPDARLDDAVRRAQVPEEYEKIVERLFQHDEANAR